MFITLYIAGCGVMPQKKIEFSTHFENIVHILQNRLSYLTVFLQRIILAVVKRRYNSTCAGVVVKIVFSFITPCSQDPNNVIYQVHMQIVVLTIGCRNISYFQNRNMARKVPP